MAHTTKVGTLEFSDMVWLTENPEACTIFIRKQMKVCKKLFGKSSPARLVWKEARKLSRQLARRRNDEEDRIDDLPAGDSPSESDGVIMAHTANHLLAKIIQAERLSYQAESGLDFFQRTYIRHKRRSALARLRYADDLSPWEAACARAFGLGVF